MVLPVALWTGFAHHVQHASLGSKGCSIPAQLGGACRTLSLARTVLLAMLGRTSAYHVMECQRGRDSAFHASSVLLVFGEELLCVHRASPRRMMYNVFPVPTAVWVNSSDRGALAHPFLLPLIGFVHPVQSLPAELGSTCQAHALAALFCPVVMQCVGSALGDVLLDPTCWSEFVPAEMAPWMLLQRRASRAGTNAGKIISF
jgi:hypothetical protein